MIFKDSVLINELVEKLSKATTPEEKIELIDKYGDLEWSKLENDPEKILQDVKDTVEYVVKSIISRELRTVRSGSETLQYSSVKDGYLVFDADALIEDALGLVDEHRDFFNGEKDDEIDEIIRNAVNGLDLSVRFYKLRTSSQVADGTITKTPSVIWNPTLERYEFSLSFVEGYPEDKSAYLLYPIDDMETLQRQFDEQTGGLESLQFVREDGKSRLFFRGGSRDVGNVELREIKTNTVVADIDLPFLKYIYSIIAHNFLQTKTVKKSYSVYLPEIINARRLAPEERKGSSGHLNQSDVNFMIDKIMEFHNIVGVCPSTRRQPSLYPVLTFQGYDADKNVIEFSSPYFAFVVQNILKDALIRDEKGNRIYDASGNVKRLPNHSFLVHPDIMSEKNKVAVENVFIIVSGIERAGGRQYHINARTLINQNPQFSEMLENTQNKRRAISRTFKKTYELLRDKTDLTKEYISIQLPDPDDPKMIPTESKLDSFVITIKHNGKKSSKKPTKKTKSGQKS